MSTSLLDYRTSQYEITNSNLSIDVQDSIHDMVFGYIHGNGSVGLPYIVVFQYEEPTCYGEEAWIVYGKNIVLHLYVPSLSLNIISFVDIITSGAEAGSTEIEIYVTS